MAIIRIKRTTGSSLPTGLTFGEMAFIGATGGATASRLYIAGPEGICVWIGAEILNSPTFWSGSTAETTLPTVSAVESRITSRLSSGTVSSFNNQTGAVQGVSAMGATSGSASWQKLAVAFTGGYSTTGATGFVNIVGITWADGATTNAGTIGGIQNGTSLQGKTVLEILQQMLFTYQSVSFTSLSFSNITVGNLEVGQTAATVSTTTTISAGANNSTNIDATGYGVTYSTVGTWAPAGTCTSGTLLGATAFAASKLNITIPTTIRGTTIGASFNIRANASQYSAWVAAGSPGNASGATATRDSSGVWYARVYWGKTANSGITQWGSATFVHNNSGNALNTSTSTTSFTVNGSVSVPSTDTGQFVYIFVPSYYTVNYIRIDSTSGTPLPLKDITQPISGSAIQPPITSITNTHGVSYEYKVYQSTDPQTASFNLYLTS